MSAPYDPRGCFQLKGANMFINCAHCGHPDIDWVNKSRIDAHNAKDKERYKAEVVKYNQVMTTMKKGDKSLKKPVYDQKPLLMRCNCGKKIFSWFNSTCPNNCKDGSCDRCTCSCMFVCSTTNYNSVLMAVMEKKKHQPPHLMTVQVVWTKHGCICKRGPRSGEFHIFTTLCNIASSSIANIHSFSATVSLHQQVHYMRILRYQSQGG